MTALLDVDHQIIVQLCSWSRTGRDGACLDHGGLRRRVDQRPLSGIDAADAIGFAAPVFSEDLLDQDQRRHRSAIVVPATTTKSP